MKTIKRPGRSSSILSPAILIVLTLVVLLWLPDQALGQGQWTTNGNDISNTNTGNVGVGTTTPGDLLEVKRSQNGGTLIRVDNPDTTSPSAFSGITFYQNGVRRAHLVSVNDGCATCIGGGGAMQLYNFGNTHMIFGTNNTERMRITNTGNVGIGTTNPFGQLEVKSAASTHNALYLNTTSSGYADSIVFQEAGTIKASIQHNPSVLSGALLFNTNGGSSPANTSMVINAAGNVGIGTTAPGYKFDVQGGQVNASGGLCIAGDCKTAWSQVGGSSSSQWTTSGANIYYNSGNVGIGTSSPNSHLHVSGSGNQGFTLQSATAAAETDLISNAAGGGSWAMGTGWASAGVGKLYFYDNNAGATRFLIDNNGNVGIGTTNPNDKLDVAGNIRMSSGYYLSSVGGNLKLNADSANDIEFYQNGVVKAGIYDGNVGIGTAAPNFNLDVNRGGTSADVILGIDANGSSAYSPMLYFRNTGAAISKIMSAQDLQFQNTSNAALLYIKNTGNVGIGTTNPTAKLDVQGDINVSGNINAKYQDVAEWVPAAHALPAGTVVILNPTQSNQVMASSRSYDTRVAGVVSERPGIALGEAGKDKVLVATTGRVRVKVDATRSSIQVGDLLTTSDLEGVAMKSEPLMIQGRPFHSPGTLIGKALEPLENGKGEILVLLSLQ
jgi:hypothetical protein